MSGTDPSVPTLATLPERDADILPQTGIGVQPENASAVGDTRIPARHDDRSEGGVSSGDHELAARQTPFQRVDTRARRG
jgi:hypothetical protein